MARGTHDTGAGGVCGGGGEGGRERDTLTGGLSPQRDQEDGCSRDPGARGAKRGQRAARAEVPKR